MTYTVHTTHKSGNRKVGPIPVTTTSADTCPSACPFNNANEGGCYANGGPLAMHWAKVTRGERGDAWDTFISTVASFKDGQLWRHNQAGGFTYTHYPVLTDKHNARVVKRMNDKGFVVNLSANNVTHADALYDLGIGPVATVLPEAQTTNTVTPKGRKVVVCPATIRDDVSCSTCQLCAKQRDAIIGFPAHGSSKRKANNVAEG